MICRHSRNRKADAIRQVHKRVVANGELLKHAEKSDVVYDVFLGCVYDVFLCIKKKLIQRLVISGLWSDA